MTVYVDPLMAWGTSESWNHMKSCHLFASDVGELHAFAARLGLKRVWFQLPRDARGAGLPHYDLSDGKRRMAVSMGAVSVGRDEAVRLWRELGFIPQTYGTLQLRMKPPTTTGDERERS